MFSSSFFTPSLFLFLPNRFLADWCRLRVSRRVSSLQDGVVFAFHGEPLPFASSSFFTASLFLFLPNLFLVDRSRLRFSWRVSSLQDGVVFGFHSEPRLFASSSFLTASVVMCLPPIGVVFFFHGEFRLCRMKSFFCAVSSCFFVVCFESSLVLFLAVSLSPMAVTFVFHGESFPFASCSLPRRLESSSFFTSRLFLVGWSRLRVLRRVFIWFFVFFLHGESFHCSF